MGEEAAVFLTRRGERGVTVIVPVLVKEAASMMRVLELEADIAPVLVSAEATTERVLPAVCAEVAPASWMGWRVVMWPRVPDCNPVRMVMPQEVVRDGEVPLARTRLEVPVPSKERVPVPA